MSDKLWFRNADGEDVLVDLSDLDEEMIPQLWRPIGNIAYAAEDFKRLPIPETPFWIKDWLPKSGKAELYGQAKAGKSFLAVQLARCIGAGLPFLGQDTHPGRVLYTQFELGPSVLQGRLNMTGQAYPNVFVATTFAMKLDTQAGQKQLLVEMEAVEPNVLILDPLYKVLSGDENEAHDVLLVLDFIDRLIDGFAKMTQLSVFILHHPGKDIARGGRGSSVLEGWVDSYIEMKRMTNGDVGELCAKVTPKLLRHAMPPSEGIEISLHDGEFAVDKIGRTLTVQERVLAAINDSPIAMSARDLIDGGVGKKASVYAALEALNKDSAVRDLGNGTFARRQNETD